jgi:predicted RNase H-like HicB family nuclease
MKEAHARSGAFLACVEIPNRLRGFSLEVNRLAWYRATTMNAPARQRFRIAVHRARGGYFARVLNLPGCIARGATEVEAVENARLNIRAYLWIAQALAENQATVMLEITA